MEPSGLMWPDPLLARGERDALDIAISAISDLFLRTQLCQTQKDRKYQGIQKKHFKIC